MMPYATSIIRALRATQRLVDSSRHLPGKSEALAKFWIAVDELIRELEAVAKFEPRGESNPARKK